MDAGRARTVPSVSVARDAERVIDRVVSSGCERHVSVVLSRVLLIHI